MNTPRCIRHVLFTLHSCVWLMMAGQTRGQGDSITVYVLSPERIAALAAAHEDQLPGVRTVAEKQWRAIMQSETRATLLPPGTVLPEWMAAAWQERHLHHSGDDDLAGWAENLAHSESPSIILRALALLATPAAKPHAAAVVPMLSKEYGNWDGGHDDLQAMRRKAGETLLRMGAVDAAPLVGKALRDAPDWWAAKGMVELLRELAPQQSTEILSGIILDPHAKTRGDVATLASQLDDPALSDAFAALLQSEDMKLRATALWSLSSQRDARALPAAMEALTRNENVEAALEVIRNMGGDRLVPLAVEFIRSEHYEVRQRAMRIVAAGSRSFGAEVAAALEDETLSDTGGLLMGELVRWKDRQYWPQIAACLEKPGLIVAALDALAKLEVTEAVPAIASLMARDDSAPVKALCLRTLAALKKIPRQEAVGRVISLLNAELEGKEEPATGLFPGLLAELAGAEAVEVLLRLRGRDITDPYPEYPQAMEKALDALGFRKRPEEIASFIASTDARVRAGAISYLGHAEAWEYADRIAAQLTESAPDMVRAAAVDFFCAQASDAAVSRLAEILRSPAPEAVKSRLLKSWLKPLPPALTAAVDAIARDSTSPPWLRWDALLLLSTGADRSVVEATVPAVLRQSPPYPVPDAAMRALHTDDGPLSPAAAAVLRTLLPPEDPGPARLSAARALIPVDPAGAAATLAELIFEPDESLWSSALSELEDMKAAIHANEVFKLYQQDDTKRREAARVLATLGDRQYAARLIRDGEVRYGLKLLGDVRSEEEALMVLDYLPHSEHQGEVLSSLTGRAEFPMQRGLARLAEAAAENGGGHGDVFLFAARMLFDPSPELKPALPWIGARSHLERPPLPEDRGEARATVDALARVRAEAASLHLEKTVRGSGNVSAEIIASVRWEYGDAPWLADIAASLAQHSDLKGKAAEVRELAELMQSRHPLRRAGRAVLWIVVLQPVVWLLALLIYPWSRLAQAMVWTGWVRRWLGFGWAGPLVLGVRWARERMWRPFREGLVPPGEVVSFDEWTFFDSVRVTPAGGGASQPALRVLAELRGVAVLRGESGLGKTTLLQALAAQAQRPVALLRAAECRNGLLNALRYRLPRHAQGDARFLRALVLRGAPDIFVDAVHEALPDVRAALTEEVNALPGANVLLTTQPLEWTPPRGAAEWQLEPLQARDIVPFLLKQGTAAVEAAGAGSLAERQRKFAARTAEFLQHLEGLPPESAEAVALRRMLSNPMEAVLAAELLAAGQTPDPNRLLAQRMEHLEEDYTAQCGDQFPAAAFAEHLRTWRASGAPLLRLEVFAGVAAFLAKHRLLRKSADGAEAWRFRHDKVMEWFLRAATHSP